MRISLLFSIALGVLSAQTLSPINSGGNAGSVVPSAPTGQSAQSKVLTASDKLEVAHHLFFKSAALVNQRIESMDKATPSGGQPLLRAFAAKLGLPIPAAMQYLKLAAEVSDALDAIDRQAAGLIAMTKKQKTAAGLIPSPPAELAELETKRQDVVRQGRARITSLGPLVSSQVEGYLQTSPSSTGSVRAER